MLTKYTNNSIIKSSGKARPDGRKENKMEVLDMAISEKELKLLMNFVKDDLKEARDSEDAEIKNQKIDRVLEHIQQYLED